MKIKISYIVYVVIATIFAGLSIFTDIFETLHFEAIFSHLGLLIAASVLIGITKSLIKELTD